jgi:uncharacterized protein
MDKQRQTTLQQAVTNILHTLVDQYQPEKIILFGSLATGEVHPWSDLDLLIVKETAQPFLARSEEVALLCMAPVGVDYLVYTPAELHKMISEQNQFVLEEVLQKGKLLYEREPSAEMAV